MAAYQLVDQTYEMVNLTHSRCRGICPVCGVCWLQRPGSSCDCFFLESQPQRPTERKSLPVPRAVAVLTF